MTSVWVVYSIGVFVGYSESLGNGRENKELIAIFSTNSKAFEFIENNKLTYSRRDDRLLCEEFLLDVTKKIPTAEDYFKLHIQKNKKY